MFTVINNYWKYFAVKENENQKLFSGNEGDYRKINEKEMEDFIDKKLVELPISRDLQKINFYFFLVSVDFNSFYPSDWADKDSTWAAIGKTYPFKRFMNEAACELFKTGR